MQHVLVSGASSGIGLAIVDRFLEAGWLVSGIDLQAAPPQRGDQEQYRHVVGDLSRPAVAERWISDALEAFGEIDSLVNCAGSHPPERTIDDATAVSFSALFSINVLTAFNASKEAIPSLRRSRGSIVNVSSLVARIGQAGALEYCATKGALSAMSKALAVDEAEHGVRVNTVLPGAILTPLAERLNSPEQLSEVARWAWQGRLGMSSEVADAVYFLAASATFTTGSELPVSGGAELAYAAKGAPA